MRDITREGDDLYTRIPRVFLLSCSEDSSEDDIETLQITDKGSSGYSAIQSYLEEADDFYEPSIRKLWANSLYRNLLLGKYRSLATVFRVDLLQRYLASILWSPERNIGHVATLLQHCQLHR